MKQRIKFTECPYRNNLCKEKDTSHRQERICSEEFGSCQRYIDLNEQLRSYLQDNGFSLVSRVLK